MAKQNLGGVYANMDFPPYEYREYPKHIRTDSYGRFEVANNEKEEDEIRTRLHLEAEVRVQLAEAPAPDPIRESLIKRIHKLAIPYNAKWSNTKLEAVLLEAEAEVDNLPPDSSNDNDNDISIGEIVAHETDEKSHKKELYAKAKALGINVHHLWSTEKLELAIAEFEDNK